MTGTIVAPRAAWGLTLALSAVPVLAAQPALEAPTSESAGCHRLSVDRAPGYTYSAAWSPDGTELFIAAQLEGKIYVYDSTGRNTEVVANPGMGPLEFTRVYDLQSTSVGELIIHAENNRSVWLDAQHRAMRSIHLRAEESPQLAYLGTIGRIVSGSYLVGRGYVRLAGEKETSGYFRYSLDGETPRFLDLAIEFEHALEKTTRYRTLIGAQMTVAGGRIYVLLLGEPSAIYRMTPDVKALGAFPEGFGQLRPLPEVPPNALGAALLLKFLQRQKMPVGLYGSGSMLYLLTREPGEAGATWRLHQIDPAEDKLVRSRVLPTSTEHLLLAPGPRYWALIEKGPVSEVAQHEIRSMVMVPSAWIEDPASSELPREAREGIHASALCP